MFCIKYITCQRLLAIPRKFGKSVLPSTSASSFSSSVTSSSVEAEPLKKSSKSKLDSLGQPTFQTHHHLMNKGELVTGVCVEEFQLRRQKLMLGLKKYSRDNAATLEQGNVKHLVIVPSSTKKYMSDVIPYVFRQNSDFFYLSGCLEPDTVLMMSIDEHSDIKSTLFMRPKDKHSELWDGPRTGVDNSVELFGVDESYSNNMFTEMLNQYITREKPVIWFDSNTDQHKIAEQVRHIAGTVTRLSSPATFVQSLRLFKSNAEQNLMRKTCQIASEAINEVMVESQPGHTEHQLYAMVDFKCRMRNASYLAYPPVVASGNNATIIHYINNSQITKSGDMVLMDAGCEYGGYTSDITRTWPVNGTFTDPQRVLYDVVLQLQKDLIDQLLKEGGDTLDKLFDTMCIKLGKYLQEAGVVPSHISDSQAYGQAGFKFCPHHVSHYLGMDVHDTPLMPRGLRLLPGMVCTVEPGIYIGHDRTDVAEEFRGLGVRIEDDILITADNKVEVLTASCSKERAQLKTS